MQIEITGRDLEITEALREKTTEKFTRHFKHYPQISRVHVIFEVHKQNQIVKAHLHLPGADINATAESKQMYESIDTVIHKLTAQLDSHKGKVTNHHPHHNHEPHNQQPSE